MGNLWRFPYLAGQYGGGIFLLVYLILLLTFGFAILILEVALGRKTKSSCIAAYGKIDKRFKFLGPISALIPFIILPYYCVIGGWVVKYCVAFLSGSGATTANADYFANFTGSTRSPLITFLIFLVITILIVVAGVQKGIERISKVLMPILIAITIFVSIYICTLPNAIEGIKFYLLPDFSKLSFKTVCAAMGQLFFSLSIAMGIMVSFGSYVKDEVSLVKSVNHIEIFDTLVAFLAGMMILPPVYIYSGIAGTKSSGPGLMFMTLPKVFHDMRGGLFIGGLFFILVFLAAITSSVSVLEAVCSAMMDKFGWTRKKSVVIAGICALVLGIPCSLGFGLWGNIKLLGMDILSFFDYVSNSVLMPLLAFLTTILIGWVVGTKTLEDEITKNGEKFGRRLIFHVMIRYIAPVFLIIILVVFNLAQFKIINM